MNTSFGRLGLGGVIFCLALTSGARAQTVYGSLTSSAQTYDFVSNPLNHPGVSDARQITGLGTNTTAAQDLGDPGATASSTATASAQAGRIGISATGMTAADTSFPAGHAHGLNQAAIHYLDTISFYSFSVLYGTPIDLHLQARVDGNLFGNSHGSSLPNSYATYNGTGNFQLSVDGGSVTSASDSYSVHYDFNGSGTTTTTTGDTLLDLYLTVPNTPNWLYTLRMDADFTGVVDLVNEGVGGDPLESDYSFLFGDTLAWGGILSATVHATGAPVTDLVISTRSASEANYNLSYVTLPAVPEPGAYAWLASALLGLLIARRKRAIRGGLTTAY